MTDKTVEKTSEKESYKNTLNLPQTEFPMKGDLPQREPQWIADWMKQGIYQKRLALNKNGTPFVMPDGPPYANGKIHIGHVLNKVLKDMVIKYRNMQGQPAVFIPGWDCHGLPIEHAVTKELGEKRRDKTDRDIRELCRTEAKKWVGVQREQFQRLGILADWDHPYLTIDADYEAEEVRELARVLDKGLLYRGEKPVYWCWALQTALAEAEVEYAPHTSPSIYVKFTASRGLEKIGNPQEKTSFVIWTTTPWTLPANLGICLHAELEYGVYQSDNGNQGSENLIIAKGLRDAVAAATGVTLVEKTTFTGAQLEGMAARHPFIDRESVVVLGDHVSLEAGTGCVHTAPGHGQEDYQVGLKYGLKIYSPVDEAGCYTADVPEYQGVQIFKANPLIVERLRDSGHLLHVSQLQHSYPHCWRSKTPLIFRATPQWFLAMDLPQNNIRQKALRALDDVQFVPQWGSQRIRAMIENRPDWCLSRQRAWGVPIPAFYCTKCSAALMTSTILHRVADAMEKSGGIEAYFEGDHREFIADEKCRCGHGEFRKGKDILDVWFDSGVCHAAVQARRAGLSRPADIYLEGSDQHRGWFQTSLLSSIASCDQSPFKALVTHGFVNDAKGRKMSKSLGNVVDPAEWIQKSGAEILRLFAAYEDYGQDLSCGPESLTRLSESYRRFRNTMRFLLGNLFDFDPSTDRVSEDQLMALDRWALHQLNEIIEKTTSAYNEYAFYKVYHAVNNYMTVDLSATYLDVLKDRLYTAKTAGRERRSAQTVLYEIATNLVRILAPITSFLAEETYGYLPGPRQESVFLENFPAPRAHWKKPALSDEFTTIVQVRNEVLKKLEELRAGKVIRANLEAQVNITASGPRYQVLEKYRGHLAEYFIVSQVHLSQGEAALHVDKAVGDKCERCWNYSEQIDATTELPGLCPKCVKALTP